MSFRRVGRIAATVLTVWLWTSCGQVYRPVVIPCSAGGVPGCPVETPPTPSNFHTVFGVTTNVLNYPGSAIQIDVSGDTIIGETPSYDPSKPNLGINPTHSAILPNDSRVFVASAGTVLPGGSDVVSSFTPMFQSRIAVGLGAVTTIPVPSLLNQTASITAISEAGNLVTVTLSAPLSNVVVGYAINIAGVAVPTGYVGPWYNGTFPLTSINGTTIQYKNLAISGLAPSSGGTASVPPQPVFLNTTQNNFIYVANYNSNTIAVINTNSNLVTNNATVGVNPVSLAEMPNGLKIYVANQGSNTVSSVNAADLSLNTVTGFSGVAPEWVVARGDSQKIYVVTEGDGQLVTIDTATDTVTSSLPVGAGANFIYLDPNLNRLYVPNPVTGLVYVFSDTGGANDTPMLLTTIPFTSGSAACSTGCTPVSVTALPDGSRFYVASYQTEISCPAGSGVSGPCVIPGLTVFDANTFTVKYPSAPTLTLLSSSFLPNQYAVPPVAACATAPGTLYSPGTTAAPGTARFRVFTTASVDGSRVYVSMCDAGAIADIITTGNNANNSGGDIAADTVFTDLVAPPQACTQPSCAAATITAFSITNNVVTFQAANTFLPGQSVSISGLTTGTYLDSLTLTVLATGLSSTQFECAFTFSNVGLTTDSGTAVPLALPQTPVFLLAGQ
jgi:YVTN family beta-propeller protein